MDVGPGDLVLCVRGRVCSHGTDARVEAGRIYTVDYIALGYTAAGEIEAGLVLTAPETRISFPGEGAHCWDPSLFRKLPDISDWLSTSTDFEEPKRAPADVREGV